VVYGSPDCRIPDSRCGRSLWGNGVEVSGPYVKVVFGSLDRRVWELRCRSPAWGNGVEDPVSNSSG
jgi:hypothetical protein